MECIADNMQKYANYKEQMGRLKKALSHGFYLEAIFIEYAIMEDRLESVLRHSGKWNPKPNEYWSIDRKLNRVAKIAEEKRSIAAKYFPKELTDVLRTWKEQRNQLIHALLKQSLHTEDLREHAETGHALVKTLCSKTTSYNRRVDNAAKEKHHV